MIWYYKNKGEVLGPSSLEDLQTLQESGELTQNTLISKTGKGEWVPYLTIIPKASLLAPNPSNPSNSNLQLGFSKDRLIEPRERVYQHLITCASLLFWLLVILSVIGSFYVGFIGLALWFGNGLFIAYLKSEAVKITPEQMPRLHQSFLEVCQSLNVSTPPELYIMESGGLLNAFATRHSGRNFVVLYTDFVEAFAEDSREVKFVLGHEIGHIQQNHILKRLFLSPGMLTPILGTAYTRSCEVTCDRYGVYAANDIDASINAMMTFSGGKTNGRTLNPQSFLQQHYQERGFFVSLHELLSGYPTLSQRVARLQAIKDKVTYEKAPRHPMAYLFAMFSFGGSSFGVNLLITFIILGIVLSSLIPLALEQFESSLNTYLLTP